MGKKLRSSYNMLNAAKKKKVFLGKTEVIKERITSGKGKHCSKLKDWTSQIEVLC